MGDAFTADQLLDVFVDPFRTAERAVRYNRGQEIYMARMPLTKETVEMDRLVLNLESVGLSRPGKIGPELRKRPVICPLGQHKTRTATLLEPEGRP